MPSCIIRRRAAASGVRKGCAAMLSSTVIRRRGGARRIGRLLGNRAGLGIKARPRRFRVVGWKKSGVLSRRIWKEV